MFVCKPPKNSIFCGVRSGAALADKCQLFFVLLSYHHNPTCILKEYGSSIQKLVDNIVNIEEGEKRTRYAHILIELMRQIHPNMKDGQDYYNKLWDDLYIMSGFQLHVDSPYPPPSEESLGKKPQRVPYNTHRLKFKHFGQNINLLIAKAAALEVGDERRAFVSYLVRQMREFYKIWNKEAVEDETIYESIVELSNGKLLEDIKLIRAEGLVESTPRERTGDTVQPQRITNVSTLNLRTNRTPREGNTQRGNNNRNQGRNTGGRNSGSSNRDGNQSNNRNNNNGPRRRR